jgi:hypothetical protein
MLQINLLRELEESGSSSKSGIWNKPLFWVAILLVLIGGCIVLILKFFPELTWKPKQEVKTQEYQTPEAPEYEPKIVYSQVVEELVKEIEEEQRNTPRYTTYDALTPAAKVEYQLLVSRKSLQFFKDRTTPRVGFSDLILTTPGDLYLRGEAITQADYEIFQNSLNQGNELVLKPGVLRKVGEKGVRREFSFYGKFKFAQPPSIKNREVPEAEIGDELNNFKSIAQSVGLQLSQPELTSQSNMGLFKRRIYSVSATGARFSEFYQFINNLYMGQSRVGIAKFALRAAGDEVIDVQLEINLYSP